MRKLIALGCAALATVFAGAQATQAQVVSRGCGSCGQTAVYQSSYHPVTVAGHYQPVRHSCGSAVQTVSYEAHVASGCGCSSAVVPACHVASAPVINACGGCDSYGYTYKQPRRVKRFARSRCYSLVAPVSYVGSGCGSCGTVSTGCNSCGTAVYSGSSVVPGCANCGTTVDSGVISESASPSVAPPAATPAATPVPDAGT